MFVSYDSDAFHGAFDARSIETIETIDRYLYATRMNCLMTFSSKPCRI